MKVAVKTQIGNSPSAKRKNHRHEFLITGGFVYKRHWKHCKERLHGTYTSQGNNKPSTLLFTLLSTINRPFQIDLCTTKWHINIKEQPSAGVVISKFSYYAIISRTTYKCIKMLRRCTIKIWLQGHSYKLLLFTNCKRLRRTQKFTKLHCSCFRWGDKFKISP